MASYLKICGKTVARGWKADVMLAALLSLPFIIVLITITYLTR
jgi:hypothetical protein